jgi:glycosyltransferase involved in cell wall biosynthesis
MCSAIEFNKSDQSLRIVPLDLAVQTQGPRRIIEDVVRILAIIVVYKMNPLATPSFVSLQRAAAKVSSDRLSLKILLYDNTCPAEDPGSMPDGVEYYAAKENLGLSSAYNYALSLAASQGDHWLLTFDQDSEVPANFLDRLTDLAAAVESDLSIAAIVPFITESGKTHSPYWFLAGAFPRYYKTGTTGIAVHDTYAFNSAAMLRVSALIEVGGYNPWFWLDASDGYIFRQLHRCHKRIFIAGDLQILHDFATTNLETKVSLKRYWNMRLAECALWDLEMGTLAGLERTFGLALIMLRHVVLHQFPEYRPITFEFLKRRLFWSRKRRLEAWEQEMRELFPALGKRLPPFIQ